jgi:succinyl-CoA synthetase beta subunit
MIADSLDLDKEFYFAIVMDRAFQGPVMVASPKGGMDIEKVAAETPELIFKEPVDIIKGVQPEQTRRLAEKLGFKSENVAKAAEQMARLYDLFVKTDAVQVEINPFAETPKGGTCKERERGGERGFVLCSSSFPQVFAVDAKVNFDENAAFRQKEVFSWRDTTEEDPREVAASEFNLNYIGMTGNIGCMGACCSLVVTCIRLSAAH